MARGIRPRRRLDMGPLRESLRAPGIDTRTWVDNARVDDDDDAIVWDDQLGWLVDVTLSSGEGPINCRVASPAQGSDIGEARPPRPNSLVLVVFPSGDPNVDAIIVGQLHSTDGEGSPASINGDTIVESNASNGQVAANETHITTLPDEDLDQEWRKARITADEMVLGAPQADQEMVRGGDLADALDDLADALNDFCQALLTATPAAPNAALTVADAIAAATPLTISISQFKSARQQYLSSRIKVD